MASRAATPSAEQRSSSARVSGVAGLSETRRTSSSRRTRSCAVWRRICVRSWCVAATVATSLSFWRRNKCVVVSVVVVVKTRAGAPKGNGNKDSPAAAWGESSSLFPRKVVLLPVTKRARRVFAVVDTAKMLAFVEDRRSWATAVMSSSSKRRTTAPSRSQHANPGHAASAPPSKAESSSTSAATLTSAFGRTNRKSEANCSARRRPWPRPTRTRSTLCWVFSRSRLRRTRLKCQNTSRFAPVADRQSSRTFATAPGTFRGAAPSSSSRVTSL
mmetsp:Transcript_10705/g.35442  ORF Transcript_10705/g.35442 Transcript_10705/m.35442 type:complete len:273 (-) Transcript_10705:274-1092(-)